MPSIDKFITSAMSWGNQATNLPSLRIWASLWPHLGGLGPVGLQPVTPVLDGSTRLRKPKTLTTPDPNIFDFFSKKKFVQKMFVGGDGGDDGPTLSRCRPTTCRWCSQFFADSKIEWKFMTTNGLIIHSKRCWQSSGDELPIWWFNDTSLEIIPNLT